MNSGTEATRWMALDVGSKRIGVAISDLLKLTAQPLVTLEREHIISDVRRIVKLAEQQRVERIVVGSPLRLGGERGEVFELAQQLVDRLRMESSIRIEWADERLSTREAQELMSQQGVPIAERRKRRDQFAAALILTWYLEEKTGGR